MIVRCVEIVDAFGEPFSATMNHWLTVGRAYSVLEIHCTPTSMLLRLLADDGMTPILVAASAFSLVDGSIPTSWRIDVDEADAPTLTIGPQAWTGDFWTRFFDDDAAAKALFDEHAYH
jgi:hypothetical protein